MKTAGTPTTECVTIASITLDINYPGTELVCVYYRVIEVYLIEVNRMEVMIRVKSKIPVEQ